MENVILNPIILNNSDESFELSVHKCCKSIQRQLSYIFYDINIEDMLIITTIQHSHEDLVNIGDKIENEKDRLLINVLLLLFFSFFFLIFCYFYC